MLGHAIAVRDLADLNISEALLAYVYRLQKRFLHVMSSVFAPRLDIEAGDNWVHPTMQPLGPALQRRAQASQRFIVGKVRRSVICILV